MRRLLLTILLVVMPICATAATRSWDGSTDNDWFDQDNWTPTGVPAAGDSVTIAGGLTVLVSNDTAFLSSLAVTNATLIFTNWTTTVSATNVTIKNAGTITLPPTFTDAQMSNRVHFVCTNFTLDAGAMIYVKGLGYAGGNISTDEGNGPGKGTLTSTHYGGGAGHGGHGADGYSGPGANPYGSTNAPTAPGSGGAGSGAGDGGGAVLIDAPGGAVTVNGVIDANAINASPYGGGGSGGSILINCKTFEGTTSGLLTANGSNGGTGSSGGGGPAAGGRIAINYDPVSQAGVSKPTVRLSVAPGNRTDSRVRAATGVSGTLYLPDVLLLSESPGNFVHARIFGVTNWAVDHIAMTNAVVWFAEEGFDLLVTNDIICDSGSKLTMPGYSTLNCGGDLVLTNGGELAAYGAVTNGSTAAYGSLVSVTGNVSVGAGSSIYCYSAYVTNGIGSYPMIINNAVAVPLFRMDNLTVAAGGEFNADAAGFGGAVIYTEDGYGPGKGTCGSYYGGGAGHGGAGANGSNGSGGSPYDSTNAPIRPGSGGGGTWAGHGGGGVRIDAQGYVHIAGTLTANGGRGMSHGGGGAGGSVFVMCDTLSMATSAVITAKGGNAGQLSAKSSGAGGGGRISIAIGLSDTARQQLLAAQSIPGLYSFTQHSPRSITVSATNGINATYASRNGNPGTVVFLSTNVTLSIAGAPSDIGQPSPQDYGTVSYIGANVWVTNSVVTPADQVLQTRWASIGWSLTNSAGTLIDSGSGTQAVINVTNNLYLLWRWTNEYDLAISSSANSNGSVNAAQVDGWYTNATVVTGIVATASNGYLFSLWTGDVPGGKESDNPLTVTMDQGRTMVAVFASASGTTKRWNGNGTWESSTNWSPAGMPGPADRAIIESGSVLFGNSRQIRSLTVTNGATMVFTNWNTTLTVSNTTVLTGGTITLPAAFTDAQMSNSIHIICTNFTLDAGASIDLNGLGYKGGVTDSDNGSGPGKGLAGTGYYGGGGSHGGYGGSGKSGSGGAAYDSLMAPVEPGSGAGGKSAGNGGGGVRIDASDTVTINGTITANGNDTGAHGGGGAGGSIFINCRTIVGKATGLLSADGGDASYLSNGSGGGGGGGRIAVIYNVVAQAVAGQPGIRFSVSPGSNGATATPGEVGTVYMSDNIFLSTVMTNFLDVRLYGVSNWAGDNLTITNRIVRFGDDGFLMTITNDIVCGQAGGLEFFEHSVVNCGGNLILTGGGSLTVYAGITNGSTPSYGSLMSVTGNVSIGVGSWVYPYSHRTNNAGGSALFRMRDLTISTNAGFNANGLGYAGGVTSTDDGYGPGKGLCSSYYGGGGGHGGAGGNGGNGAGGPAYDGTNAPVKAGSGAGGTLAGNGGGAIRIEATGKIVMDGTLSAEGLNGTAHGGGGAGGSIFVICSEFLGGTNGVVSAQGGNAGQMTSKTAGGGGGGRVAIWHGYFTDAHRSILETDGELSKATISSSCPTFLGTSSATNGINATYSTRDGEPGTLVFIYIPHPAGTIFILR